MLIYIIAKSDPCHYLQRCDDENCRQFTRCQPWLKYLRALSQVSLMLKKSFTHITNV